MATTPDGDIFVTSVLNDKVKLSAADLHSGYRDKIDAVLKRKLEGKCTRHGLIKMNSIELLKISAGVLEVQTFKGAAIFNVKFRADVCNPLIGSVVRAKVQNFNSFGILCVCSYTYLDAVNAPKNCSVLEIIVPKKSMAVQSEVSLNSLKIGQMVNIEVMGKKFQLNDMTISVMGRVIKTIKRFGLNGEVIQDDLYIDDMTSVDDVDDAADLEDLVEESENGEDEEDAEDGAPVAERGAADVVDAESDTVSVDDVEEDSEVEELEGGGSDFEYDD